jgi:hypothetical protein
MTMGVRTERFQDDDGVLPQGKGCRDNRSQLRDGTGREMVDASPNVERLYGRADIS